MRRRCLGLTLALLPGALAQAAAPPRAGAPYAEALCLSNPDVFFCEDFEDPATAPSTTPGPGPNCVGSWRNPAFVASSYCWNQGGSVAAPAIPVPGPPATGNRIYNFPIADGTIDGYLRRNGQGAAYTDYHIRWQFYYSGAVEWPVELDIKQMLSHPEVFVDPPSANYQNGIVIHQDYFCSGLGNFGDVISLRYGPPYEAFPVFNEYCPPLAPGQPANNQNAVRLQRNRWYTVEVRFRLGTTSATGLMEAWLDGNLMYRANRATCTDECPPMAYVYFTGYKAPSEPNFDGFVQYDNIVMSRSYVGVPSSVPVPSLSVGDVTVAEGNAGTTQAVFPVSLSAASTQAVSVAYQTANGTATAGSDYTAVSGSLTFAPGTAARTVNVPVLGDTLVEPDETFWLNLSSPAGATLADGQGQGTISDDDAPSLSSLELTHGSRHVQDLSAASGPSGGQDAYRLAQQPHSSYEVALDAVSGDVTPLVLQRLAADNVTVLQSASSTGTGSSVRLRFENASGAPVVNQAIRVLSGGCSSACGAGDAYRIRAWETTGAIARFNNGGSQVTVLVLQNAGTQAVAGRAHFWSGSGVPLATHPFTLAGRATLVLNTSGVSGLSGQSGSITVTHDGGYGALAGKAVSLEPATGYSFDSPLNLRSR